ncbi:MULTISPECIES: hemin uptake protein HemP [Ramlibacter]|uniref:Hemin uptake protein HemP n=1 Tax=Ramlibacter pinisoli TaxID=2682844 RepID=A0A6N8INA2_9BURK|nr:MULTISPECIES: hemin uptake protein HemP [Ramlibacter]MBA2963370.1 hemin uptake protein HemP [Ramlibacter sp. CGMCC 1.13660]MVQ28337.1 hemin uptake protein HemP [Ramlibacter pinisoli]
MTPPAGSQAGASAGREEERSAETLPSGPPTPLDSTTLLRGGRSVEIRHNGEIYRLQATRLGKLILTK